MEHQKVLRILLFLNIFIILFTLAFKTGKKLEQNDERLKKTAEVARYMIHNINWATVVTFLSTKKLCVDSEFSKSVFGSIKSIADGTRNKSTGIPYFYLQKNEPMLENLRLDNRTALTVTIDQTKYCQKLGIDTVEPKCSRVILMGRTQKLNLTSEEFDFARSALKESHPHLEENFNEKFLIAKLVVENIKVVDGPGGLRNLPLDLYYKAEPIWKDDDP
ncbi:protein CREG1-like [Ctenocephalides felis]|uniref:protein CREG1-like n=1 Tax=Ctenocephalides felis TaxID=7515 RepID=UPI000E6E4E9B|nr:protein CREG1-like [Ctenocephalides felis]